MSDILQRLRFREYGAPEVLCMDAADEIERLRTALEKARIIVLAHNNAEHMLDGFGKRKQRPSDDLVAEIEAALSPQSPGPSP